MLSVLISAPTSNIQATVIMAIFNAQGHFHTYSLKQSKAADNHLTYYTKSMEGGQLHSEEGPRVGSRQHGNDTFGSKNMGNFSSN
jgi:hypothetical protein